MSLCGEHLTTAGAFASVLLGIGLGIILAGAAMTVGGFLGRRSVERDREAWEDRYGHAEVARDSRGRLYDPEAIYPESTYPDPDHPGRRRRLRGH